MIASLKKKDGKNVTFEVTGNIYELDKQLLNIAIKNKELACELTLKDNRKKSNKQNAFMWAMIDEICRQDNGLSQHHRDMKYAMLKAEFAQANEIVNFKTSTCTMHMMNRFINWIIGYMLLHDYNVHRWIVDFEHVFNSQHYYIMLLTGRCFVTGKKTNIHLHHFDRLGAGNDRTKWKNHLGLRVMLLEAYEHEKEHSYYQYMLKQKHINPDDLPVVDEELAKLIVSGKYKLALTSYLKENRTTKRKEE